MQGQNPLLSKKKEKKKKKRTESPVKAVMYTINFSMQKKVS
jgi:hypothetical protein